MNNITFTTLGEVDHTFYPNVDQDTIHNIQALFNRTARGTLYRAENGRLQVVSGIREHLSYYWNRSAIQTDVKGLITQAVASVRTYLEDKEEKEINRTVETLFERIGTLSSSVLDRLAIPGDHLQLDSTDITPLFQTGRGATQEVMRQALIQLNEHLQTRAITLVDRVILKNIFLTGALIRMSDSVFDRGAIAEGSTLETILAPDIPIKRGALQSALKHYRAAENKKEAKDTIEILFMDLVLAEYDFAYRLGFDLKRIGDGGSGGARYGRDRFGEKLIVVKPGDEGPHGVHNPQRWAWLKRWFVSPRVCLRGNSEPQTEVDSYLLAKRLGIPIVPPTELRYIASKQFNGKVFKECSVQMFIGGAKPLREYLSITPKMHILPRRFLRWRLGTTYLPRQLAEQLAVHNLAIEDIDCHFDNVLLKEENYEETIFDRLFSNDNVDTEIDEIMNLFFKEGHSQALLRALLSSERVGDKRVTIAKHDGGSSNPHQHPEGFLPTRFKHFFEVLPNYNGPFTTQHHFANREQDFIEFLLEKGTRALRNLHTAENFRAYWDNPLYRQNFKSWILERDGDRALQARALVIDDLIAANNVQDHRENDYRIYFRAELERIYGTISTRVDSWKVLQKHLQNSEAPMRQALLVVTPQDFVRELRDYRADDIEAKIAEAKIRPVANQGTCLEGMYIVGNSVLQDLGERNVQI